MKEDVYTTKEGFPIPPDHIPSTDDMERLADGDKTVIPILVEGLIGYVNGVLDSYISKLDAAKPYKEDLTSEALLTLCTFVEGKVGEHIESTRFMKMLSGAVKNNTNDWLRESTNTITIPSISQRTLNAELIRHPIREGHALTGSDDIFEGVSIEEFIDGLNPIQEKVLRMKMDDFSDYKIAKELDLHRGTVSIILDEIKTLYGDR